MEKRIKINTKNVFVDGEMIDEEELLFTMCSVQTRLTIYLDKNLYLSRSNRWFNMIALFIYTATLVTVFVTSAIVVKNVSVMRSIQKENDKYDTILKNQNTNTSGKVQNTIEQTRENDLKILRAYKDSSNKINRVKIADKQDINNLNRDLNRFRYNDRRYKEKLGDRISEMSNIQDTNIDNYITFVTKDVDRRFANYSNLLDFQSRIGYKQNENGYWYEAKDFVSKNNDMPEDSLLGVYKDYSNRLSYLNDTVKTNIVDSATLLQSLDASMTTFQSNVGSNLNQIDQNITSLNSRLTQATQHMNTELLNSKDALKQSVDSNIVSQVDSINSEKSNVLGIGKCILDGLNYDNVRNYVQQNCASTMISEVVNQYTSLTRQSEINSNIDAKFVAVNSNVTINKNLIDGMSINLDQYKSGVSNVISQSVDRLKGSIDILSGKNTTNQTTLNNMYSATSNYEKKSDVYNDFVSLNNNNSYVVVKDGIEKAKNANINFFAKDFCQSTESPSTNVCLSSIVSNADTLKTRFTKVNNFAYITSEGVSFPESSQTMIQFKQLPDSTTAASISGETNKLNIKGVPVNVNGKVYINGSELSFSSVNQRVNTIEDNKKNNYYVTNEEFLRNANLKSAMSHAHESYQSNISVGPLNNKYNTWKNQPDIELQLEPNMFTSNNVSKFQFDTGYGRTAKIFDSSSKSNWIDFDPNTIDNTIFTKGTCSANNVRSETIIWNNTRLDNSNVNYQVSNVIPFSTFDNKNQILETETANNIKSKVRVDANIPVSLSHVNFGSTSTTGIFSVSDIPVQNIDVTNLAVSETMTNPSTATIPLFTASNLNVNKEIRTNNQQPYLVYANKAFTGDNSNTQVRFCPTKDGHTSGECKKTNIFVINNPTARDNIRGILKGTSETASFIVTS